MKVTIMQPHGVCGGVERAISLAKKTREKYPQLPITVLGHLVHNETITLMLEQQGIHSIPCKFYEQKKVLESIPSGVVIFTAHGHDKSLEELARKKGLLPVDATCPFVEMNFQKINAIVQKGEIVFFIGLHGHPEAEAARSISPFVTIIEPFEDVPHDTKRPIHILVQTTLSMEEKRKTMERILSSYPTAIVENEVCNATEIRQESLKKIPSDVDCIIVVGGLQSANTEHLRKIATSLYPQKKVVKIASKNDLTTDLKSYSHIALVGGASTLSSDLLDIQEALLKESQ